MLEKDKRVRIITVLLRKRKQSFAVNYAVAPEQKRTGVVLANLDIVNVFRSKGKA